MCFRCTTAIQYKSTHQLWASQRAVDGLTGCYCRVVMELELCWTMLLLGGGESVKLGRCSLWLVVNECISSDVADSGSGGCRMLGGAVTNGA